MEGGSSPGDVAAAAVAVVADLDQVETAASVPKGHRHECWCVVGRSRTVMLKLALFGTAPVAMVNLAEALRLASESGVPSPRLLWSGTSPPELGSRPMLIQEFLPGADGYEALDGLDSGQRSAFYQDWGAAVGRLHSIRPGCFSSSISEPHRCHATWLAMVDERLAGMVTSNREAAVLSEEILDAVCAQIRSEAARVSHMVRPAMTHGDVHTSNTLVDRGRFVALLDFEHAKFWDPIFDFVKLGMWTFESIEGSQEPFMEGYRSSAPPLDAFEERLRVCTGLELLAGFPYWKRVGEPGLMADYRRRLDRLLDRTQAV